MRVSVCVRVWLFCFCMCMGIGNRTGVGRGLEREGAGPMDFTDFSFRQVFSSFVGVTKWDRIVFTTSRQVNLAKGPQIALFYICVHIFISLGEYGVGNLGVGWEREETGPIFLLHNG